MNTSDIRLGVKYWMACCYDEMNANSTFDFFDCTLEETTCDRIEITSNDTVYWFDNGLGIGIKQTWGRAVFETREAALNYLKQDFLDAKQRQIQWELKYIDKIKKCNKICLNHSRDLITYEELFREVE